MESTSIDRWTDLFRGELDPGHEPPPRGEPRPTGDTLMEYLAWLRIRRRFDHARQRGA